MRFEAIRRSTWRALLLAGLSLGLSACANKFSNATLEPVGVAPEDSTPHTVLVTTNRTPEKGREGPYFDRGRDPQTRYAKFDIAVPGPKVHREGRIEIPRRGRGKPGRHFVAVESRLLGEDEFRRELNRRIRSRESKTLIIFVHGFKVRFAQSVFYVAQLERDAEFTGTAIVAAWPSGGSWFDYVYDRESAMTARNTLEDTIRLGAQSEAERILVIAHSMGSYLTMETLRQKALRDGDPTFGGKLQSVILAAPDVSVDVFKSQLRDIGTQPKIAVQQSGRDKLLPVASLLTGKSERIGSYEWDDELRRYGVHQVDMRMINEASADGHYALFANPKVFRDIFRMLETSRGMSSNQPLAGNPEVLEEMVRLPVTVGRAIIPPFPVRSPARAEIGGNDPDETVPETPADGG